MTRALAAAFVVSTSLLGHSGVEIISLEGAQSIERQISAGGRDTYHIALDAGQYAGVSWNSAASTSASN